MDRAIARPGRWRALTLVAAGLSLVPLVACTSSPAAPKPTITDDIAVVTGLGATRAAWEAHHRSGYATVITDRDGRVDGFLLVMPAGSLTAAVAAVRQELPPDATAGTPVITVGVEGTKCEIVDFDSPTLRHILGGAHGDQVMAVFETDAATVMDANLITQASVVSANAGFPRRC